MNSALERVLEALERNGATIKSCGRGWLCTCPTHDDQNPSLSVYPGTKGAAVVVKCGQCPIEEVLAAIGLTLWNLYEHDDDDEYNPDLSRFDVKKGGSRDFDEEDADYYVEAASAEQLQSFADYYDLSIETLNDFKVGYCKRQYAYTIPERNEYGEVIGFGLKRLNKWKSSILGSTRGLIIPWFYEPEPDEEVEICEGASDTFIRHDNGYTAIGIPSAGAGFNLIKDYLVDCRVTIMTDSDAAGDKGGKGMRNKLQDEWDTEVELFVPPKPYSDIREWTLAQ